MALHIHVAGPAYRKGPYPTYDPSAINESRIPDPCRFKEYKVCDIAGGVCLKWTTQEPFTLDEFKSFVIEVKRAFKHQNYHGKIRIIMKDRDSTCYIVRNYSMR